MSSVGVSSLSSTPGSSLSLFSQATYVRALRPALPLEVFAPARSRIVVVPILVASIAGAIAALANGVVPWYVAPLVSLVIGACFGILAFVAHEAMHGAIVRNRRIRHAIGFVGFLPFVLSPRLWAAWHDRIHHAHANRPDDPDAYPTLDVYGTSRAARFAVDHFSPGGGRLRGMLSLALGFTGQSLQQLISGRRYFDRRQHLFAIGETALGVAVWAAVAWLVGWPAFAFAYLLPLLVANAIVMAFILTNHSLSPRVEINDPLVSSLSVTTPRWIEWLTLGFGYHVEHHLFPAMSSRHARTIRDLVVERWPERYQSMPLGQALLLLHRTARVYKDDVTLIDPTTQREHPVLLPR
jgi:fatty acid desaturase